jgi:hypothetical protein
VATRYLPDTLRAYLVLPADWAADVPVDGSRTATDLLREQVATLEDVARRVRDATVAGDAAALLANGRFLAERFPAGSALDL